VARTELHILKKFYEVWYTPAISAHGKLRQEDLKFKGSLGYTVRPCLRKKKSEPMA
jgi:hypothetical protein